MSLSSFRRLVVITLLSSVFTACGDDPDPNQPPPPGAIGGACAEDATCKSGTCLQDPSFPGGYCLSDCKSGAEACQAGSTCINYLGYQWCFDSCTEDKQCRDGYVCDYNTCRPPCTRQDHCKVGERCSGGRCNAPCTTDAACTPQRCQDGVCVPPCTKDTECLPGERCDTATGSCQAGTGKKLGEACTKPGSGPECATGFCLPTRKVCSITCKGSADCPVGSWVCGLEKLDNDLNGTVDGAVAACVPRKGAGGPGALCAKDDDCASEHCYNGWCLEGCAGDANCPAGQSCADVSLLLQAAVAKYKGCIPKASVGEMTLGTFTDGQLHGFDIPSTAQSFVLVTQLESPTEIPVVAQLSAPDSEVLFQNADQCDYYSQPNRYLYSEQISSALVPNTNAVKIKPGIYTYMLTSTKPGLPITVKLLTRTGKATSGKVDVNWVFLNLSGTCIPGGTLNATSAPTHGWFKTLRDNLRGILQKANLDLGQQTFRDLKSPALDIINMGNTDNGELGQLFATTKGLTGRAINIFFVRDIQVGGGSSGGIILGIAGGIPGPPGIHGTAHSGLAMSMQTACFEQYGYNPAHTLAHEMGHYLGLFHNMESQTNPGYDEGSQQVLCPCPCGENLVCTFGPNSTKWCRGLDHLADTPTSQPDTNLMFYAAENTQDFSGNQLSPTQQRVMLDNPLVR